MHEILGCGRLLAAACLLAGTAAAQDDHGRLNVAFVVWDGMELIESMGPAHVFAFAPGMDEYTVSASVEPIRSEFVTIVPEHTFDDCPPPDVIVIPGGSMWTPMTGEAYRGWLRRNVPRARLTVSVCNSAILLADLGLLDGREATCGDGNLDDIMLLGRDVKAYINRRWVHSGNIITSESYLGGLDAAIYAVGVLRGEQGKEQVLRWSNYDGDLSRFEAMHAEPGVIPVSRRREVCGVLMKEGVDAAVRRYQEWVESGEPAYTPPLDRLSEPDMFQWMAWGNQRLGRHEISLKICEFKARIWPDSARERAYLGEALMKAGRVDEALAVLLEALDLDEGNRPARVFTATLLARPDHVAGEDSRRARAILRRTADSDRAVLGAPDEPGEPLEIAGMIRGPDGTPVEGGIVHVYQADANGNYTPTAPADEANPRLFAFLRTGADGRFSVRTVRPGHGPATTGQPRHISVEVEAPGFTPVRTRLYFADDPHLDRTIERDGNHLLEVEQRSGGVAHCACEIELEAADRTSIEQLGEMRAVMRDGQAEPRARLVDIATGADVYAVGAMAGLHGEVTVWAGETWIARVAGDACRVTGPRPAPDDAAALLTVARVPHWGSHALDAEAEGAALETLIERIARSAGIDTSEPFPFLIECDGVGIDFHVVNGYCPHGVDPGLTATRPWRWSGDHAGPARIVGFFAQDAAGTLTHHGTSIHAHVILALDGQVTTGHADALRIPAGAVLRLPAVALKDR